MESIDKIIHAKWIITCEEENKILEDHALIIDKGLIKAILPSHETSNFSAKSNEKYSSHAILPGFINAHTHSAMNYFRGLADDLGLMNWLQNYIWPVEKKWLQEEFVYDASRFAIAEMIRSGTTCFNDMYFFLQATAKAVENAGLRAHIGMTILEFPTNWAQTTEEYFSKGLEFFSEYQNHSRIKVTIAPHAPYTISNPTFLRIKEIAEKYNLKINLHLHETANEIQQSLKEFNMRPIKRLQALDLISDRLIAIHMTQLDEEDLAIIAKTKPHIVHCPESNMKLASGICPVKKLQTLGLNIGLGTDGAASNNDLNMLGEMHSATMLAKIATQDPETLSAENTLKLATLNGAKALGIATQTGSLTPGKQADFIAIDLADIETQPLYHPISQIIYAASRNQVSDVWVAGKPLLKKRKLTTLDEEELLEKAKFWRNKIKS